MRFHEKLKRLCGERRLTQAHFLREMPDVGKTTMYYWFTGRNKPDLDSALRIAKILGVPLDYLADDGVDDLPTPEFNDDERLLVEIARNLEGGAREALKRVVNTAPQPRVFISSNSKDSKHVEAVRALTDQAKADTVLPPEAWPPIAHQDLTQSTLRREREARRAEVQASRKKAAEKTKRAEKKASGKEK